jgi:small subunit ribosomal protein S16
MSVKLRMTRMGRRHRPFYRINVIDSRTPRDGRIVENLGHYDPIEKDLAKQLVLKLDRVKYWLEKGAIPSDTVAEILSKQGIKTAYLKDKIARRAKALAIARKKSVPFTKGERAALAAKKAEEAAAPAADAAAPPSADKK